MRTVTLSLDAVRPGDYFIYFDGLCRATRVYPDNRYATEVEYVDNSNVRRTLNSRIIPQVKVVLS